MAVLKTNWVTSGLLGPGTVSDTSGLNAMNTQINTNTGYQPKSYLNITTVARVGSQTAPGTARSVLISGGTFNNFFVVSSTIAAVGNPGNIVNGIAYLIVAGSQGDLELMNGSHLNSYHGDARSLMFKQTSGLENDQTVNITFSGVGQRYAYHSFVVWGA